MAEIKQLTGVNDWEALWPRLQGAQDERAVIFKHSTRCGVSAGALASFKEFAADFKSGNATLYLVDVISNRDVSQKIASDIKLPHASPQALVLGAGGDIVWSATHFAITVDALKEATA